MNNFLQSISGNLQITVWDAVVMFGIVAFDEYVIKGLILHRNEKYKAIYTYAPIVLSVAVYAVLALIMKTPLINNIIQGFGIGVAAMGSYDVILRVGKDKALEGFEELGEAIKKEVDK